MSQLDNFAAVHADVDRYYSAKVQQFGPTPHGVDWRCMPTQELRFVQLLRLCESKPSYSLNDLGCGYGALLGFLKRRHKAGQIDYAGVDLCMPMVEAARRRWPRDSHRFTHGTAPARVADYSVASGIFNVKLDQPEAVWRGFIQRTLAAMHATSTHGFAFNLLLDTRDAPPQLYRASPQEWVHYCAASFKARVDCLTGYGMPEATFLVRY